MNMIRAIQGHTIMMTNCRLPTKIRRSRAAGPFSSEADGTREEGKEGERRGKKRGRERGASKGGIYDTIERARSTLLPISAHGNSTFFVECIPM